MARHHETVHRSGAQRLRKLIGLCVTLAFVVVATPGMGRGGAPGSLLFALASHPTASAQALDAAEVPAARVLIFSDTRAEVLSWEVDGGKVSAADAELAIPISTHRGPGLSLDAAALGAGTHTVSAMYSHPDTVLSSQFRIVASSRGPNPQLLANATPHSQTASPAPSPTSTPNAEPPPTEAAEPPPTEAAPPPPPQAAPPSTSPPPGGSSGWPDASTTGPRDGHNLTPSGPLVITVPGAVVSDLDVDGCIDVQAPNVTITDVRVSCERTTTAIRVYDGASATVAYVEIHGNGVVSTAVGFSNYTLSHVDVHDVIDGPRINSSVQILDSYIHDLARTSDSHNDALQTTGGTGIVIRGNNLQAYNATLDDPMNACFMIGSENAPLRDVVVEHNLLNGGNYSILARDDLNGSNIVIRGNQFGRNFRYGPYRGVNAMDADSSNVWADTLTPIL